MERLAGAQELLDGPLEAGLLAGNLRDLARINRLLGGSELSWRAVSSVAQSPGRQLTMLDLGTGGADIPRDLLVRAGQNGIGLAITASDVRPEILDHARRLSRGVDRLRIESAEPDRLAYRADSFDIVHASLVLHHLEPPDASRLLAEMGRVARAAVIVNDLDRARRWHVLAWLMTRLLTANRYTRHDAPMSVRRAYTPDEASALAAVAGLREVGRLRDRLGHRYALVLAPTR
jgi:ubiquinone/menaquinone biosynthesis C-methylase UbiE